MYSPDENSDRWSGLYITALTGYTWGKVTEGTVTAGAPTDVTTTLINGIGSSLNGFNGSVKFGYNKQIDTNLIGIEFGGTWQNAVSKNELIDTLGLGVYGSDPASPTAETTLKTYETASVRAGHIFNNTMSIYMSGGVALGQIKRTINDSQCDWLCTTGGFVA